MASPMKADTSSLNVTAVEQVESPLGRVRRYNLRGQERQEAQLDKQRKQLVANPIVKLTRIKLDPVHPDCLGSKGKLQLKSNLQVVIRRCDDHISAGAAAVAPVVLQSSSSSMAQPNKPKSYKRKWKSAPDAKQPTELVQQAMAKKLRMRVVLPPLRVRKVLGEEGHGGARTRRVEMVTRSQMRSGRMTVTRDIDMTQDENNNHVTGDGDGDMDKMDMTDNESHVDLNNNLADTISIGTSGYSSEVLEVDLENLQISSSVEHQIVPFGCSDELKDTTFPDEFAEADAIIEAELKKLRLNPCNCVAQSQSRESADNEDAFLNEMISFADPVNPAELPSPPGAQANVLKYEKVLGNITYDQIRAIPIDSKFWKLVLQGEEGDMSTVKTFEKDVAMHFFQRPKLRWSSYQYNG